MSTTVKSAILSLVSFSAVVETTKAAPGTYSAVVRDEDGTLVFRAEGHSRRSSLVALRTALEVAAEQLRAFEAVEEARARVLDCTGGYADGAVYAKSFGSCPRVDTYLTRCTGTSRRPASVVCN